jgi:hypothetical protein
MAVQRSAARPATPSPAAPARAERSSGSSLGIQAQLALGVFAVCAIWTLLILGSPSF